MVAMAGDFRVIGSEWPAFLGYRDSKIGADTLESHRTGPMLVNSQR
jgi:hypothetical protein